MSEVEKVLKQLKWGAPAKYRNETHYCARPTVDFWPAWEEFKSEFKERGIRVEVRDKSWFVVRVEGQSPPTPDPQSPPPPTQIEKMPSQISDKLREYQREPAEIMFESLQKFRFGFDASDMGTGKSYMGAAVAASLGFSPLVICPKAVCPAWRRVFDHFGIRGVVVNYEKLRKGNTIFGKWNGDSFDWTVPEYVLLMFDEAQCCGGLDTKNSAMLISAKRQKRPVLMMSGTLAESPMKMMAAGFVLELHQQEDFYRWIQTKGYYQGKFGWDWNCGMRPGQLVRKNHETNKWDKIPEGQRELQGKQRMVMASIGKELMDRRQMVRLVKTEIPGFPECEITPQCIDFGSATADMNKVYREMEEEIAEIAKKSKKWDDARTAMLRARQMTEMMKVSVEADLIKQGVEQGYHVAVFLNFNDSIDAMAAKLKTDCIVRGNDGSEADRQGVIDAFQNDDEPVIIVNSQCGGAGIGLHDLHGNFPRWALINPTFWAALFSQVTGRVWRDGAKTKAYQSVIFAAGTLEENVFERCYQKVGCIDALNDADLMAGLKVSGLQ